MNCSAGVVASGSVLSHTGNLTSTTLFTPGTAGLFRVNMAFTFNPATVDLQPFLTWNDGTQSNTQEVLTSDGMSNSVVIYSSASNAISLAVTEDIGTAAWSVRYSIEAL